MIKEYERYIEASLAMKKAKQAVIDWMEDQARSGQFAQASQAPGWRAYVEAESAYNAAFAALPA